MKVLASLSSEFYQKNRRMQLLFLVLLLCVFACSAGKQQNSSQMNDSHTVILYYEPLEDNNDQFEYYFNKTLLGNNEAGFKKFLDSLDQTQGITEIIVKSQTSINEGGKSLTDSFPFSSYEVGYQQLVDKCEERGIRLSFDFF